MREWYRKKSRRERRALVKARDPAKVRAADRARYERNREERIKLAQDYARANPERVAVHKKRWIERNPEKRRAQVAVGNAVRDGRLVKGPCERGSEGTCRGQIEAHHDDYAKPLEVRWMCSSHHAEQRKRSVAAA